MYCNRPGDPEDRLDGAWDGLEKLPTPARREWKRNLDEAVRRPPSAFEKNWSAVGCLQAAYAAVLQTNGTVERRLQAAVHAGGDTDRVATVAGALLKARWGTEAIPSRWRSRLGDRWGHTADDIVRLAEAIAETRYKRLFA